VEYNNCIVYFFIVYILLSLIPVSLLLNIFPFFLFCFVLSSGFVSLIPICAQNYGSNRKKSNKIFSRFFFPSVANSYSTDCSVIFIILIIIGRGRGRDVKINFSVSVLEFISTPYNLIL